MAYALSSTYFKNNHRIFNRETVWEIYLISIGNEEIESHIERQMC